MIVLEVKFSARWIEFAQQFNPQCEIRRYQALPDYQVDLAYKYTETETEKTLTFQRIYDKNPIFNGRLQLQYKTNVGDLFGKMIHKQLDNNWTAEETTQWLNETHQDVDFRPKVELWDLFEEDVEYAGKFIVENGIPQNTHCSYVSRDFLDAYINHVDLKKMFVIERYRIFDEEQSKLIADFENSYHGHVSTLENDVFLFGETETSYWVFWYDCDISDCCIGRLSKDKVENIDELISFWKEWQEKDKVSREDVHISENIEQQTGYYQEVKIPKGIICW